MYHCHVCFYFIGNRSQLFDIIKDMPALASSEHDFIESNCPNEESASKADVIMADLSGIDAADAVRNLAAWKKQEADLILLAEQEQFDGMADCLDEVTDIWTLPMSDAALRFHFCGGSSPLKCEKIIGRPASIWRVQLTVCRI